MTPKDRALRTLGGRALAKMGNEAQRKLALERAASYRWFLEPLVTAGWSLGAMQRSLEAYRIKTPSGQGRWTKEMVRRIVSRLDLNTEARAA